MKPAGPLTVKGPGPSELDDIEAPSDAEANAFRQGFAAHVAARPEFHQAVKELLHTQGPRRAEQHGARGPVRVELLTEGAALAPPEPRETRELGGHDTLPRVPERPPEGARLDGGFFAEEVPNANAPSPSASAPDEPQKRGLRVALLLGVLAVLGGAVWMWASDSSGDGGSLGEAHASAMPKVSPAASSNPAVSPSLAPSASLTASPTSSAMDPATSASSAGAPSATGAPSGSAQSGGGGGKRVRPPAPTSAPSPDLTGRASSPTAQQKSTAAGLNEWILPDNPEHR